MNQNKYFYSYQEASLMVEQFERILNSVGIKIETGSDLERICLNVVDMLERHIKPELPNPIDDFRTYYSEVLGLNDLIAKIIRVENHPCFSNLIPHLKLLNEASVPQNIKTIITGTGTRDSNSNKLYELLIGAICMSFSSFVELETPNTKRGKIKKNNPDVLFSFCDEKWAIACKVMHTNNIITFKDEIIIGINQIEKADVTRGIVCINLKNIINHDDLWPITNKEEVLKGGEPLFKSFPDIAIPTNKLCEIANKINYELLKECGEDYIVSLFKSKKALPGCLLFLQTGTSISLNSSPYPTTLGIFNWIKLSRENISEKDMQCLYLLNCSMHNS